MQLDMIGYRYTTEELSLLMSMQGYERISAIPWIKVPSREQFSRAMGSLEDKDMVSTLSGQLLLDRIPAFLIDSLCGCERYFSVSRGKHYLVLCVCPKIAMMAETRDEVHWVLHVTPEPEGLREEFTERAASFEKQADTVLSVDGDETFRAPSDPEALAAEIDTAFSVLKQEDNLFE